MAAQYSFVMKGLSKTFPGAPKPILNNVHLQFYPDAKIGIVGPNGPGQSTLMKIMAGRRPVLLQPAAERGTVGPDGSGRSTLMKLVAGRDREFVGEAWPGDGIRVGY